jgi:hypothetical protein
MDMAALSGARSVRCHIPFDNLAAHLDPGYERLEGGQ